MTAVPDTVAPFAGAVIDTVGSVVYGTEAGIFRKTLGVPTVVCGPGDIAQAHQPNEFLLASQVDACEGFMRRMVEWACRD